MTASLKVPKDLTAEQYIAVEDSLLSSESGRAFLRMRDRRTSVLTMDEFHGAVRSIRGWFDLATAKSAEDTHLQVLRRELLEMASSIRKAKIEISAMKPAETAASSKRINLATEELDAIVHATERATSDILNSAERILELSEKARKHGLTEEAGDLDNEATNILVACGFQDITGQRISKVVATLRYLEERVDAMIRIWGLETDHDADVVPITQLNDTRPDAHLLNGPALRDGNDQNAVDSLFDSFAPPVAEPAHEAEMAWPEPEASPPPPPPPPPPPAPPKVEKKVEAPKKVEPKPAPKPEPMPEAMAAEQMDQSSIDSLFP